MSNQIDRHIQMLCPVLEVHPHTFPPDFLVTNSFLSKHWPYSQTFSHCLWINVGSNLLWVDSSGFILPDLEYLQLSRHINSSVGCQPVSFQGILWSIIHCPKSHGVKTLIASVSKFPSMLVTPTLFLVINFYHLVSLLFPDPIISIKIMEPLKWRWYCTSYVNFIPERISLLTAL